LLAPTGRAAKVLSAYSKKQAFTIHRKIYRLMSSDDGTSYFGITENKHKNTLFIIDEASMIGETSGDGAEVYRNDLLENLLEYVYSGENCRLIFCGDIAQLPPVGTIQSPALQPRYLKDKFSFRIMGAELKEVVRQASESGILFNATSLRLQLMTDSKKFPVLVTGKDIVRVDGSELEDVLNDVYSRFGEENCLIITRSNKRANQFNQQIRVRIKYREQSVTGGDLMMVVKNNYNWLGENSGIGFIANGDSIELLRVKNIHEMYGLQFAEASFRFIDYPEEKEIEAMLNLSVINSENAGMTFQEQRKLAALILEDLDENTSKGQQMLYLRNSPYYNALQVKFNYAVTCHKSQGGQWPIVLIDQGYITEELMGEDFYRWLYTAITRATEKVYLINFSNLFFP
jgi:exodeoxyribonuclease-5